MDPSPYFYRGQQFGLIFLRLKYEMMRWKRRNMTVVDAFAERVRATPNATALIFERTSLSFSLLDHSSNQYVP